MSHLIEPINIIQTVDKNDSNIRLQNEVQTSVSTKIICTSENEDVRNEDFSFTDYS